MAMGMIEKICIAVMGEYYTSVRSSVFSKDSRGANEHSAAELHRRGVRVAFGNEVGSEP